MYRIGKLFRFLLDLVFPPHASVLVSDTLKAEDIECLAATAYTPAVPFACIAPLPYRHQKVKALIQATKYYGHTGAPYTLSAVLAPILAEELSEKRLFGTFTEPLLIPIPLHKDRLFARGYNQAERIARALLETFDDQSSTLCTDVLVRSVSTEPQTRRMDKQSRIKNMKGAFSVSHPEKIAHRDILLLDDVVTTGATFASARNVLCKAGAREVLCIAVAH